MDAKLIVILASEAVSLWLLICLWKSEEHPFLKIILSLLSLIPVLGPAVVLWISRFPERAPQALQDRSRHRADVYDRWADTLNEKNPHERFRKWQRIMDRKCDGD